MALRGQTQDFGLADALQLIVKGSKSGILRCDDGADDIRVLIEGGWVRSIETAGRPNDARLGNRLLRAGVITQGELGTALSRRAATSEPITEILLDLGFATHDTLAHYVTLLATDTLFEIFTWPAGTYEFMEGDVQTPRTFLTAMSLDEILLQGIVLIDEWPTIQTRIPSHGWSIDQRWPMPPEQEPSVDALFGALDNVVSDGGGFDDEGPTEHGDGPRAEIGPNERVIHDLCVPGTDVQSIVDRAPFHRFETFRCLSNLIAEHFVRLRDPARAEAPRF